MAYEVESDSVSYLAIAHGAFEWGIAASKVARIVRGADWTGAEPLDLAVELHWTGSSDGRERVVEVVDGDLVVPLWAGRKIGMRAHRLDEVLALPSMLFVSEQARDAVVAVVVAEGERPLLVVEPMLLRSRGA
jgi:hypothetical protein